MAGNSWLQLWVVDATILLKASVWHSVKSVVSLATADNSVKQKKCPYDFPRRNFTFLEAHDVVFAPELVDLGSAYAFLPSFVTD